MKSRMLMFGLLIAGLMSGTASAQIVDFGDDFQAYSLGLGGFVPIGNGWEFFNTNGAFPGYGGAANADGPQISAITGDGAGNQYLNVFADYNNPLQASEFLTLSVFQNQTFSAGEAASGATRYFAFDYAKADPGGVAAPTTTAAYIRAFDGAFNLLAETVFDTTGADFGFASQEISLALDPGWTDGGNIQFGFTSTTTNFSPSGVYYDNVNWAGTSAAVPEPSSLALLGVAGLGAVARRRRRR